jgi:hypothetical protein
MSSVIEIRSLNKLKENRTRENSQYCETAPPSEYGNNMPAEISSKVTVLFLCETRFVTEQCHEDSSTIRGTHGANVELFYPRIHHLDRLYILTAFPQLVQLEGIIFGFLYT